MTRTTRRCRSPSPPTGSIPGRADGCSAAPAASMPWPMCAAIPMTSIRWAEAGGARWSYEGLLDGFRRSEDFSGPAHADARPGRSLSRLPARRRGEPRGARLYGGGRGARRAAACRPQRIGTCGVSPNSLNIRDGRRVTVADAYLTPDVLSRPNLSLLLGYEVEQLTFSGQRATGVLAVRGNETVTLQADRLVLCAGAIDTPLLLMRSGIGDRVGTCQCRDRLPSRASRRGAKPAGSHAGARQCLCRGQARAAIAASAF